MNEGGLQQSKSHKSIGLLSVNDEPRKMTLRSSAQSKYKVPHNITTESHSSAASFQDYKETPEKDHYGQPIHLITDRPQFIVPSGQKIILKKGDVVYLSEVFRTDQ